MASVELLVHVNDNEIAALKREIKELTSRKHQIKLDADEARDLDRRIRQLRIDLQALGTIKERINLDGGDLREVDRLINETKTELDALTQQRFEIKIATDDEILEIDRLIAALKARLDELTEAERVRKQEAADTAEEYENQAKALAELASAMEKLGDISKLTQKFAEGIGDSFSRMADMFSTNIFDQVGKNLTRLATEALVGDFTKIMSRYDILSTFSDYMELAGVSSDKAADALQRVNDSILGLPIGLDESAQRLRRYQMFLGDLEKSTNLTIGLQKAIYAGGANEQARSQSFYQIDRLLSVGKLNTARQWNALLVGLGVSLRYIGEELGYEIDNVSEFAAMLSTGKISTDEFLGALMRLGEGGSEAASKLDEALGIYKGTLESWMSNIRFAAVRGGVTILNALNDVMKDTTDVGLVGYLEKIRNSMNDLYKGIGNWITGNPDLFARNFESIERLIYAIDRFSASNIAAGIFDNLARGVDMLTDALRRLPTKDAEEFFVFATTLAGPLGSVFKAVASGAGTLVGVFQRFKNFDFESLISKIITQIDLLASAVERLLRLVSDSAMEDLLAFGLVWGGPASKVLGALAKGTLGLAATLKFFSAEGNAAAAVLAKLGAAAPYVAGGVVAAGVAFAGITMAIAQARRDVEEAKEKFGQKELDLAIGRADRDIADLESITIDVGVTGTEKAILELRKTIDEIKELDKEAKEKHKIHIESGITDKPVPSSDEYIRMRDLVNDMNLAYPEAKLRIDPRTRTLDDRSRQILDVITAQEEYNLALETSAAAEAELEKAEENRNKLLEDRERMAARVQEKEEALADARRKLTDAFLERGDRRGLQADVKALEQQRDEAQAALDRIDDALMRSSGKMGFLGQIMGRAKDRASEIEGSEIAQTGWWAQLGPARAEVENLINTYKQLGASAEESIEKQLAGFGKLEKEASKTSKDIEGALKTEEEILDRYINSSKEVERYALETGDTRLQEALDEASQMGLNEGGAWIEGWNKAIKEAQSSEDGAARLESLLKLYDENRDKAEMASQASSFISAAKDHFEQAIEMNADDLKALGSLWLDAVWGNLTPSDLINSLPEEFKNAAELFDADSDVSFTAGLDVAKQAVDELTTNSIPALQESIGAIAENESTLITAINNVKQAATEAIQEVIRALDNLMIKITAVKLRAQAEFPQVVTEIDNIKKAVEELIQKLQELTGQTWVVNVEGAGDIAGAEGGEGEGGGEGAGGGSTEPATGGLITGPGKPPKYYKKGGWVFMKPHGTDTVPAMLTPGEYVLRKGAVDQLGVPFLQRLNRLDIAGAIDNLMHRFYRPSQASYSVVNNSADNRAYTVTQNIYTNNPDYTYHVAARFAHAL